MTETMEVTTVRNPYPVPDVSREGVWIERPVLGNKVSPKDKAWSTKLKAHERLFAHHTLNSIRKDRRLMRSQVPDDALDLALTTVYVHSKDTLVPKVYVTMQPEALGRKTWRVLKNVIEVKCRTKRIVGPGKRLLRFSLSDYCYSCFRLLKVYKSTEPGKVVDEEDPVSLLLKKAECYRGPVPERRVHPSNMKLNFSGPHLFQSNPGYSRKIDGTFYSI